MDFLCVFLDTNFLQRLVLFKVKIEMKLEENSHHALVLFCSNCFQYAMHQTIVLKNSKGRKLHFCSSRLIILIVALQSIAKQYCTSYFFFIVCQTCEVCTTQSFLLLYDLEQLESQDTFFGSMEYGALQALLLLLQMQKQVKNEVFSSSSKYGDYNSSQWWPQFYTMARNPPPSFPSRPPCQSL